MLVQSFQPVLRLGRLVTIESILFPLAPAELPPGASIPNNEVYMIKVSFDKTFANTRIVLGTIKYTTLRTKVHLTDQGEEESDGE